MDDCSDDQTAPRFFGVPVEGSSRVILALDSFVACLLAGNVIASLLTSSAWLNFALGVLTLTVALAALISLWRALMRRESLYLIIPLIFQAIMMTWCVCLAGAGLYSVVSGHLWSVESLIGIRPHEIPVSKDITDENYHSPDETSPETSRAIFWGQMTILVMIIVFLAKLWSFIVLRILYYYYLQFDIFDAYESSATYVKAKDDFDYDIDDNEENPYDQKYSYM